MTEMWEHFKQCYTKLVEKHPFQTDKAGFKTKASMGKIQICAKGKKVKQVMAHKSGLSVDLIIIYELEKEKLQTVLKAAK